MTTFFGRAALRQIRFSLAGRVSLAALSLLLTAASGWLILAGRGSPAQPLPYGESMLDWIGPYESLEELASKSDIVVLGEVVAVEGTDVVLPPAYDPTDSALPKGVTPGITFTRLRVSVKEYLKGSGPQTLTMRQTGDLTRTNGSVEFPKPAFNRQMLLFLTAEPERGANVWASNRGPWGRMSEDKGSIYYAWGDGPREVPFLKGKSLGQATEAVKAAIAAQRR